MIRVGLAKRARRLLRIVLFIIGTILIAPLSEAADVSCVVTFDPYESVPAEHLEQLVAISLTSLDGKEEKWIRPTSQESQVIKNPPYISAYFKGLNPGAYQMRVLGLSMIVKETYFCKPFRFANRQNFRCSMPTYRRGRVFLS